MYLRMYLGNSLWKAILDLRPLPPLSSHRQIIDKGLFKQSEKSNENLIIVFNLNGIGKNNSNKETLNSRPEIHINLKAYFESNIESNFYVQIFC